jgi:adenosine deaminase
VELNPLVDSRRLAAHPHLGALLRRMPKAELHLHLDGCLRPATALALARERGLDEGLDLAGMRERLAGPAHATDQAELLRAFDLPIAIMQDAESLRRITAELVEDVVSDGTRYAEIRWAPGLHMARGLSLADGIAAVVRGAHDGVSAVTSANGGPDGSVHHDKPDRSDAPVVVRLIAVAMRSHDPRESLRVAEGAAAFAGEWLTGFDVAGPEAAYPDVLAHRSAVEAARSAGLGISIHAGEWGGSAQVRRALELDPARIAHGAPAVDDPALMAELRTRGVTLDLCPTSNVQAGMYARLADHPLPRLLRTGVPVTLSTDERTVTGVTLVEEYRNAVDVLGLTLAELWAIDRHALEVAFLADDEPVRAGLLGAFDAFAADEPPVRG